MVALANVDSGRLVFLLGPVCLAAQPALSGWRDYQLDQRLTDKTAEALPIPRVKRISSPATEQEAY